MTSFWDRDDDAVLLQDATDEQRDNKDVVVKSIREYGGSELQYASPRLQDDEKVILEALFGSYRRDSDHELPTIWSSASKKLKECREKTLSTLSSHSTPYMEVSNTYKNLPLYLKYDHQVTLAAVERVGLLLEVVPPMFRDDMEVVISAVLNDTNAFNHASPRIQDDKGVIATVIQRHPETLESIFRSYRDDKEMCLAVVEKNSRVMPHLSTTFQYDKDFVMAAIKAEDLEDSLFFLAGSSYEHLLEDDEVALALVSSDPLLIIDVEGFQHLQDRKHLVLAAVTGKRDSQSVFERLHEHHRRDRDVVLAAVSRYGTHLQATNLQDDKEVVLAAVSNSGYALRFASLRLKSDREVVLAAVTQDGTALEHASDDLKSDFDIVYVAAKNDDSGLVLRYASQNLRNNEQIVLEVLSNGTNHLCFAGLSQRRNMNVLTAFHNRCPRSIFDYGVCPVEWGRGTTSLKDYIVDVLRRIDGRGTEHVWVQQLLDPSTNPDRRTIASSLVHMRKPALRMESVMQSRLPTSTDEPAIKQRIVDYSGMALDAQYYNELARCEVFINMAITSGSPRFLNNLFQEAYGREVRWSTFRTLPWHPLI